jgi:putative ABC transport system permease protein
MTNLLNNVVLTLVVLVVAILAFLAVQGLRRPVLAKIGLRNIPRRPAQSVLIIIGLTLSTIIIISALSIGDTLNYSVQRQAVAAFGEVDEILAPPLLSLLVSLGSEQPDSGDSAGVDSGGTANAQQQQLENLTAGGLTSVLAVLEGGLPGISMERYAALRTQAEQEPLIDGVAGSILFPTIIRNSATGQGEPLGFVFAVDQDYDQQFGVTTVEGERVTMAALQPGVGNIFAQAANVFGMAQTLARDAGLDVNISDLAVAAAGLGAVLTGGAEGTNVDLNDLSISTETLGSLGIDTTPLEEQGIYTVTLAALGITTDTLQSIGVTTTTVQAGDLLSNTLGLDTGQIVSATNTLLGSFNLNTLGREIDAALEPFGLQLRQGDVYLNRLGAQQLDASVGDLLEIYVGPLPIPVRVKGIVQEAGPVGAVLPVVMMGLDEAQKLFFMNGKVNNVLISNAGDAMTGVQHTDAVSERLRVLAMDEAALAEVVAILRRPDVQPIIRTAAEAYRANMFGPGDGPQPIIAELIENILAMGATADKVEALPAALQEAEINAAVRTALADTSIRSWLLNEVDLPADAHTALQNSLSNVNQFDVIDGLNKATLLTVSNAGGGIFTSIFTFFGTFSIIAAIMLIFLIFVMLATERRSEMGIARAIGVQRGQLVQMFVTEGMVYDLLAAALGVALGLGVSYAMIGFLGTLFNNVAGTLGAGAGILEFHFRAAPTSIIIGYCLGVLLTYIVVTLASWRVSRLNIVTAIRDLPEESNARRRSPLNRIWRWSVGPALLALGGYLLYLGQNGVLTYWQLGATLLLLGGAFLLERILEQTRVRLEQIRRLVYTLIGLGLLVIWGVPWNMVLGRSALDVLQTDQGWILLSFGLSGPLLILGAILAIMFNAGAITWLFTRLLGGFRTLTPVLRTAIAYPLSARFRTGMAMVMFAMIIATVVIMALVIQATQSLIVMDEQESAGFEISTANTLLSFFNPLRDLAGEIPTLVEEYPQLANVAGVGAVAEQEAQFRQVGATGRWRREDLVGIDGGYIDQAAQIYTFQARAAGYADDAAIWQALRERTDVAIITPDLANTSDEEEFGPPDEFRGFRLNNVTLVAGAPLPELFIEIRQAAADGLFDEENGAAEAAVQQLQVIGVLSDERTRAGGDIQANLNVLERVTGAVVNPDTFYIKVNDGADVRAVQQEVERAFLSSGINVTILAESFAIGQEITRGILRLFQGFMALGLLVGIAALGVISTRTVVERRQQIGMLRAIGFQSNMVALSLVLEASFIALAGLLIGAGTGILLGENVIRTFFTDLTPQTQFPIPWVQIGLILLGAYLFSLLTTIVPAYQAARIYPAEALRYE